MISLKEISARKQVKPWKDIVSLDVAGIYAVSLSNSSQ